MNIFTTATAAAQNTNAAPVRRRVGGTFDTLGVHHSVATSTPGNTNAAPIARPVAAKFQAGKTYSTRSVIDSDFIIAVTVARRTPKTIVTTEGQRLRISEGYHGHEYVKPWGSYSMAPAISADSGED